MANKPKPGVYIVSSSPSSGMVKLSDGRTVSASEGRQYPHRGNTVDTSKGVSRERPANPGMSERALDANRKGPSQEKFSTDKLQRFLKGKGYDIAVDGVYGKETASAVKDWKSGAKSRDPEAWNLDRVNPVAKYAKSGTTSPSVIPTAAKPPKSRKVSGGGGRSPAVDDTFSMDNLLKTFMGGGNGNKVADALTAASNNPTINAIQRAMTEQGVRAGNRQEDAKSFFGDLVEATGAARDDNAAALTETLGKDDSLMSNIIKTLGADVQGQFAQRHDVNTNELKAQGLSQRGYDNAMIAANRLRGRDERNSLRGEDDATRTDLQGALMDALAKRGQDTITNRYGVQNQNMQNKSAAINQLATLLLLPGQQAAQGDQHALSMAQIYKYTHPTPAAKKRGPSANPSDYDRATKAAMGAVVDPETGERLTFNSTGDLVRAVNSGFVGTGLHSKDKNALAARNALLTRLGVKPQPVWKF